MHPIFHSPGRKTRRLPKKGRPMVTPPVRMYSELGIPREWPTLITETVDDKYNRSSVTFSMTDKQSHSLQVFS